MSIITLVGGSVGGYITFAGGHRLLDAGISGEENLDQVNRSSLMGIGITRPYAYPALFSCFGRHCPRTDS